MSFEHEDRPLFGTLFMISPFWLPSALDRLFAIVLFLYHPLCMSHAVSLYDGIPLALYALSITRFCCLGSDTSRDLGSLSHTQP